MVFGRMALIDNPVLNSPFDEPSKRIVPETGKIAVKVINHHGDEVLKVFEVASSEG
jgi:hypothetical protein